MEVWLLFPRQTPRQPDIRRGTHLKRRSLIQTEPGTRIPGITSHLRSEKTASRRAKAARTASSAFSPDSTRNPLTPLQTTPESILQKSHHPQAVWAEPFQSKAGTGPASPAHEGNHTALPAHRQSLRSKNPPDSFPRCNSHPPRNTPRTDQSSHTQPLPD